MARRGSWRAAAEARGDKAGGGGERGRARPSGRPRSHGRGKEGGDARGREEDGGVKAAERRGAGAERAAAAAAVAPAGAVQGSAAGSGSGVSSALPASLPAGGDRRTRRRVRAVRGRGEYPAADRARPNPQTLGLTDRPAALVRAGRGRDTRGPSNGLGRLESSQETLPENSGAGVPEKRPPHVRASRGVGRGGSGGGPSAWGRWPGWIDLAPLFSLTPQQSARGLGKFPSGGRSDPRAPGGSFLLRQKSGPRSV